MNSLSNSIGVNLRVILIDDTLEQRFDPIKSRYNFRSIDLIRTGGGKGYGESLRYGTENIQSEIVGLFNSDDLISPARFKKQIPVLDNSELSITGIQRITSTGKITKSLTGEIYSKKYDNIYLLLGAYGANATWVMQKTWWEKNAFMDNHECLDWRIGLKTFQATLIHWNPEKLYFYRKHKNQVTYNKHISDEKMFIVYNQWRLLAESYGLSDNNQAIFNAIAVPWLKNPSVNFNLIQNWIEKFLKIAAFKEPEIFQNAKKLIYRRYLKALAATPQLQAIKDPIFYKALTEVPGFFRDVIYQIRN